MIAYLIHTATLITIYVIIVLSYAIPVGYTGMLNLGHVGLLALGAYTAALLTTKGVSFWLAFIFAAVLSGIAAYLLALPSRRIKGDYYALITLGFTLVVNAVLLNATGLTGGPFGISGIRRPEGFVAAETFFLLTLVAGVLTALFVYRLVKSPLGKALEAVRDDDLVAESLGKPTVKLRVVASVISGVVVGGGGALLAHFLQFINPQLFWFDNIVFILSALVVGGLASFRGAIAGTVLLFVFLESVRFLGFPPAYVGPLRLTVFSLLLLFTVLFHPKGIFGRAQLED